MAITFTDGSQSIGTIEFFLASASTVQTPQTTKCVLQVWIDLSALTASEAYAITLYEKVNAGTQRVVETFNPTGVEGKHFVLPSFIVGDGWDIGVKKISGTDRTIAWSLRKIT